MPLYDYTCTYCNYKTEILHRISETPSAFCQQCQREGLQKCISAPSFKLQGTGWYETDFKPKKSNDAASQDDTSTTETKIDSSKAKSTTQKETN